MSTVATPLGQLAFLSPPPGLEPFTDFTLVQLLGTPGLFSLTSTAGAARLFVLDAAVHLPAYTPQLPAAELDSLGLDANAPLVLVVVNPGVRSTVNLSAPIIVNPTTGVCAQIILEGDDWPLRHPLAPTDSTGS